MDLLTNIFLELFVYMPMVLALAIYRYYFGFFNFCLGSLHASFLYIPYVMSSDRSSVSVAVLIGLVAIFFFLHSKVFLPMKERGTSSDLLLVASLGGYILMEQVLSIYFGDHLRFGSFGLNNLTPDGISQRRLLEFLIFSTAVCLTFFILFKTELGDRLRAASINPDLYRIVGLDSKQLNLQAILIVLGLIMAASTVGALETGAAPTNGFATILICFALVLLGGSPYLPKLILVVLGFSILNQFFSSVLPLHWTNTVKYSLILLIVILAASIRRIE